MTVAEPIGVAKSTRPRLRLGPGNLFKRHSSCHCANVHSHGAALGLLLLVEHVHPATPVLGWLFHRMNLLTTRVLRPNINRDTVSNIT